MKAETLRKHTHHTAMKHIMITYTPPPSSGLVSLMSQLLVEVHVSVNVPCQSCFGTVLLNPPSIHTFILISNLPCFCVFRKRNAFNKTTKIFKHRFCFRLCSKSCQGYHCASHGWASQVIHLMAEGTRRCKSTAGRTSGPGILGGGHYKFSERFWEPRNG